MDWLMLVYVCNSSSSPPFFSLMSQSHGKQGVEMSRGGQVFQLALVGLLQSPDKASIVSDKAPVGWFESLWCSETGCFSSTSAVFLGGGQRRTARSRWENLLSSAFCAQQHLRRLVSHSRVDSCLLVSGHPRLLLTPSWMTAIVASWHGASRNQAACLCPQPYLALACPVQETTCSGQVPHLLSRRTFLLTFWPGICPYHVCDASSWRFNP